jgi:hypothetical protein
MSLFPTLLCLPLAALVTCVGVFACLRVCLRLQGENVHEPNYGCRGVQQEWEFSGRRCLMARECMHTLARTLQVRARAAGHVAAGRGAAVPCMVAGWHAE